MTTDTVSSEIAHPKIAQLEDVRVRFGKGSTAFLALDRTNLTVHPEDFIAMVGPSGCGKSTILKLVAGLLRPTEGNVFVAGREVGAEQVGIGMAFQNPTMLPWLTIRENIMLPLKIVKPFADTFRRDRNGPFRERAEALLARVGLAGFGDRRPWELSGGMLQRANLCRALIHSPKLLMLDEPFGALDQFTREELWAILQDLWMETKPTVFLVTHDLREAAFLASRILVMSARPGRVVEERTVDFAWPRTLETTFEPDFARLTNDLRRMIAEARQVRETAA